MGELHEFTHMHGLQCPSVAQFCIYFTYNFKCLNFGSTCSIVIMPYKTSDLSYNVMGFFWNPKAHHIGYVCIHCTYNRFLIATLHSYNYSMINQAQWFAIILIRMCGLRQDCNKYYAACKYKCHNFQFSSRCTVTLTFSRLHEVINLHRISLPP